jgi:hypothetical protein
MWMGKALGVVLDLVQHQSRQQQQQHILMGVLAEHRVAQVGVILEMEVLEETLRVIRVAQ